MMFVVVHRMVIMFMMMLEGVQAVGAERSLENLPPVLLRQSIKVRKCVRIAGDSRRTICSHFWQRWQWNLVIAFQTHAAAIRFEVIRFTPFTTKALRRK